MESEQRTVARKLAWYFRRNGYLRRQKASRVASDGWERYKKGDELRLVAESAQELQILRDLLVKAGLKPGEPFRKGRQFRQPVYGRQAVARFLELIEDGGDA